MKKQVFKMTRMGADPLDVEYYPIVYMHGSNAWRLALHREPGVIKKGAWIVSDPVSGCWVCRIGTTHKGVPVSSAHLTITQARQAAMLQLDATVERVGVDRFTSVLNKAQND